MRFGSVAVNAFFKFDTGDNRQQNCAIERRDLLRNCRVTVAKMNGDVCVEQERQSSKPVAFGQWFVVSRFDCARLWQRM